MDLRLILKALDRHRIIVAVGLGLAVLLATLSYVRPAYEDTGIVLKYREQEEWQSQARVLVTVPGFSSGRSLISPRSAENQSEAAAIEGAEARLAGLAVLYAGLATGDEVRKIARKQGPIRGKVVAAAVTAVGGNATLPIVEFTAVASSARGSRQLANRYTRALQGFVTRQQDANDVSPRERVALALLNRAGETELVKPRSTTLPVIVFLTILSATVGLVLVLENLRRRVALEQLSEDADEVPIAPVAEWEQQAELPQELERKEEPQQPVRRWA